METLNEKAYTGKPECGNMNTFERAFQGRINDKVKYCKMNKWKEITETVLWILHSVEDKLFSRDRTVPFRVHGRQKWNES